jgi:uncharacterized protein
MLGRFSKRVLLTGAGWSRNWGAPLAGEVWQQLFGHAEVRAREPLLRMLRNEPRFEAALAVAAAPPFTADDRLALERALTDVFVRMDREIGRVQNDGPNIYGVQDLVFRFAGAPGDKNDAAYIFTLNQDLFPERRFYNEHTMGAPAPALPGITMRPGVRFFTTGVPEYSQGLELQPITDPANNGRLKGQTNVIKLHGSFNWRSPDGANLLVVGDGKAAQIDVHPLLAWYRDIFHHVLAAGDVRLMIIGYGFADAHINAAIADSIEDHGLGVFIWNTAPDLKALVTAAPHGARIWNGVIGAATRSFIEVFPSDQARTEELLRIKSEFFG